MNLAAGGALPRRPETGVWFRAIQPQFWTTSLATAQTAVIPSRFNAGANATPPFAILSLAENPLVALFEVQALFGSPTQPGGVIPLAAALTGVPLRPSEREPLPARR